eukprot:2618640-Ditylum_brightwellii.AAC.1
MPGALAIGGKPVATSNLPSITINTSDHSYFNEPPKLFKFPYLRKDMPLDWRLVSVTIIFYYSSTRAKLDFLFTNIFQVTTEIIHGSSISTTLNLSVQKMLSTFSDHVNIRKKTSLSTYSC